MNLPNRRGLAITVAALTLAATPLAAQQQVFDSFDFGANLPGNVVSQCLQCNQLNELGQVLHLVQGGDVTAFSFVFSDWAKKSDNPGVGTATTFTIPVTFNAYSYSGGVLGAVFYTMVQNVTVQYRPEASAGCGTAWKDADGNCWNGLAQIVNLNLPGLTVPQVFAYTLAFSTCGYGPAPLGSCSDTDQPTNSLNFGVTTSGPLVGGVDAFVYDGSGNGGLTSYPVNADGPVGDNGYILQAQLSVATPEPGTLALAATGLVGLAGYVRRRRNAPKA